MTSNRRTSNLQTRTFTHNDLTLSYEDHGQGEHTVVYLHGLLLDAAMNRQLAVALADVGNRVLLLDLPGHGGSDKPMLAADHRMDRYATCVLALLDELAIDRAVIGGVSLGANVSLQVLLLAPERVAGLIAEMPVLEKATPYAAMLFARMLSAIHLLTPLLRMVSRLARKVHRERLGRLDMVFAPLTCDPAEIVAVLHGVLVGPVAPTVKQRQAMNAPAVVIGHRYDLIHSFGDAKRLARQLPNARFIQARSVAELRVAPPRLTGSIADFLDSVWAGESINESRGLVARTA